MEAIKLTFIEKWFWFWGFRYVLNKGTKEIHSLSHKSKSCRLDMITKKQYITHKKATRLNRRADGHNGCRFCWKIADIG